MAKPATNLLKMPTGRLLLRPNGHSPPTEMPTLIYGTAWKKDRSAELVYTALKAGFRAVDTAAQPKHYREDLVGEGIRKAITEGIVKREDIYVSTLKPCILWNFLAHYILMSNSSKQNTPQSQDRIRMTCHMMQVLV